MQTSAMNAGFQIAECSLSSALTIQNNFFQMKVYCWYDYRFAPIYYDNAFMYVDSFLISNIVSFNVILYDYED